MEIILALHGYKLNLKEEYKDGENYFVRSQPSVTVFGDTLKCRIKGKAGRYDCLRYVRL